MRHVGIVACRATGRVEEPLETGFAIFIADVEFPFWAE